MKKGVLKIGFAAAAVGAVVYVLDIDLESIFFDNGVQSDDGWSEHTQPSRPASNLQVVETDRNKRRAFANIIRDPYYSSADPDAIGSVVYESRVPMMMNDPTFDALGELVFVYGNSRNKCTATITTVEGYDVIGGKAMISTARHCVFDKKTDELRPIHNFTFYANYVDVHGDLKTYKSGLSDIRESKNINYDVAVATLDNPLPAGFVVANLIPQGDYNIGQFVSAPGYSGDKVGAYIDEKCKVTGVYTNTIINTCDIMEGVSGGPLVHEITDGTIGYSAVLSGVDLGANLTYYSVVTRAFLNDVDFLTRSGVSRPPVQPKNVATLTERVCVEVMTDKLNIRSGAGTEFNVIGSATRGDVSYKLRNVGNWAKIELGGGGVGYVSQKYTQDVPCY